jgi:hypothetical protein
MKESDRRAGSAGALRWLLGILVATAILATVERSVRPALEGRLQPTAGAAWIWAELDPKDYWASFFAVRDFEVDAVPTNARLLIAADEGYVVFLNGHPIGSGRYRRGQPMDAYEVAERLIEGTNRFLVELRSARGVGGLLLSLTVQGSDTTLVLSDGGWKIVDQYRDPLKWPGTPLSGATTARVWDVPPTGRWGRPRSGPMLPTLERQLLSRRPVPALLGRLGSEAGLWHPLAEEPRRTVSLGNWITFDFGRELSGYLNVVFERRGGARGLVYLASSDYARPRRERPTTRLMAMVGQGSWTDSVPRRFRFATVVSTAEIVGARAFVLKPDLEEVRVFGTEGPEGVFGLHPPALRSPVEDEFWSEFESVARFAGGQGIEDLAGR